jgi:hypothetical protein
MRSIPVSKLARLCLVAVPALAMILGLPGTSHAQRMTGDISGTVVDDSGAVIPGANVTLTNESSLSKRTTVTNAEGFFSFASVPPATYTVTTQLQGFKTYEVKGVLLRGGDSRSMRTIRLGVAQLEEVVSVSAEVALTPLSSGEKSTTLTAEQIENISIVGRSAAELLRVMPGLTPMAAGNKNAPNFSGEVIGINGNGDSYGGGNANQSAIGNFSGNGTRTFALDITIDGAPGADPGCNCATSVNPNPEMIQEFKVLQSNFGAEHAKGPIAMNVVSKSGGRDFHGTVYSYFRDFKLNSNYWELNKAGGDATGFGRPEQRFFFPGFNVSGPLLIPGTKFNKNRDKVFFFVGYEYFGQRLDTGVLQSWVPDAAMRNGDFRNASSVGSGWYVNSPPSTYAGGIVPASAIDPGGKALLNLFPMPNANPATTGGYNYFDSILFDQNGTQALARLDINVSDNTKVFLRYNRQRETQPWVVGFWWRNAAQVPYPTQLIGDNRSDSVTASMTHVFNPTLTNETLFGLTFIDFPNAFEDPSKVSRSALGYPYKGIFNNGVQQVPSVFMAWGGGPAYYNPGGLEPVFNCRKWQVSLQDNITKVAGTHTIKGGVYWEYVTNEQMGSEPDTGRIVEHSWGSLSTGNGFADLLTGVGGEYFEQSKNVNHPIAYNLFEGYVQDSWKVKPRLTLEAGVRASFIGAWYDFKTGQGLAVWDQSKYSASAPPSAYSGVVWNARDSSVPLSGAKPYPFSINPRVGFAWDLKGTGETVLRGGFGAYRYHEPQGDYAGLIDFPNGVRNYTANGLTLKQIDALGATGNIVFGGTSIDINDDKQPTTYTWSGTVQQKLPWAMTLEASYVGTKSSNQWNSNIAQYNEPPLGSMINDPTGDPNAYRPMKNYGQLQVFRHSAFQNYHGLQMLLARQRGRFNFTAAYTFSKALGVYAGGQGAAKMSEYVVTDQRTYNYGVLSSDRTHVGTASYSWLFPRAGTGIKNAILGEWQITGITSFVSGAPLQAIRGNFGMTGTLASGQTLSNELINGTPNVIMMPVLSCDPTENVQSGYLFNPACFTPPSPGKNGNWQLPYMKGQSYWNHDLSVFKNFSLGGEKRLQLRFSAYNFLNHPIPYPDDNQNLTVDFLNGKLDTAEHPDFGKLPTDRKFGRRIVQLGVRFSF